MMIAPADTANDCAWGSRSLYLLVLLSLVNGTSIYTKMTSVAIANGAAGYLIGYVVTLLLIGIPLLYMEFIISQFTARNCIDVWKVRSCLSFIGYLQMSWQIYYIIYNHMVTTFVIHYFLISFENPIPYHTCGGWSSQNCNIAASNFTVNEDCIKTKIVSYPYCDNLYTTFPEIQYWLRFILGVEKGYYYIAWRVCLASGIACILTYFSCFKRKKSIRRFIWFFMLYPTVGYFLLFIGSMMQKGVVEKFEEGLDSNFLIFPLSYRVSEIIIHVIYTLHIGTGIAFNLGASTSFRAPCYSNVVITVMVCVAFVVLTVCTIIMVTCPYAYQYNTKSHIIMNLQITHVFERLPRLLKEFDDKAFWLIIVFSSNAVLGLSTNCVVILSLLETFAARYSVVDKYTGLVTFGITIFMFLITIPLLGSNGAYGVFAFGRQFKPITVFIAMIEVIVFVIWYGVHRFSEDVHFMQGIQPSAYMKLAWVGSSLVLGYVFVMETYFSFRITNILGPPQCTLILYVVVIVLIPLVRISIAACKKKFQDEIKLNPMWGPRSEVLVRSRAMFSAQAMTKEYMYRQYHLQAGILARQRTANVRRDQAAY